MEKDGACKMDRQNKNAVELERVGEGRIMLELIKKMIRNWLGYWLRRNCLLKDTREEIVKWEESSKQEKISNNTIRPELLWYWP